MMSTIKWTSNLLQNVRVQIRPTLKLALLLSIPVAAFMAFLVALSKLKNIEFRIFVEDPSSVTGAPSYVGVVSNVGILIWASAAAICLFTAYVLHKTGKEKEFTGFFLWSGLFTATLLIDDFFMFHDSILYVVFGINENLVYLAYGIALIAYVVRYRDTMQKTPMLIFVVTMGFFFLSTGFDKLPGLFEKVGLTLPISTGVDAFFEESLKLFAVMNWLAYYALAAAQQLKRAFTAD